MTGFHCPVEGCDYGEDEEKSLTGVRSHINATTDDAHDWPELKPEVEAQGEEDVGDVEDEDDDEEFGPDDHPKWAGEDAHEADQTDTNDDDPEDDEMPTDEEYQAQHGEASTATTDDGDEEDDATDHGTASSSSSSSDDGGFSVPALGGNTTLILLGLTAIVVLVLLVYSRDGGSTISDAPTTDSNDGEPVSDDEVSLVE